MAKQIKTTPAATPSIKVFQPDETQPTTAPTSEAPAAETVGANQAAGESARGFVAHLSDVNLEELIQQAEYKQHPYGKSWHPFDGATFSELVSNVDRRGLDKDIVLYQDMVLEGWHRYLACLATKTKPKFTPFKGTDLQAAELVHASGIRRHSTPEQRYASFDLLCDACPEFKAKFDELRAKGEQQQKAGTPLATGNQRVDVIKAKAHAAGVSKSTTKKVEKVKKTNPKAVAEIAAGKTTANNELKKRAGKPSFDNKPLKDLIKKMALMIAARCRAVDKGEGFKRCLAAADALKAALKGWQGTNVA